MIPEPVNICPEYKQILFNKKAFKTIDFISIVFFVAVAAAKQPEFHKLQNKRKGIFIYDDLYRISECGIGKN